ncbi:CDP-glycerol glycerophosphotransferase [Paucidesulfovibrio gracilis DSM 16080]|uniref:CDP-glycerol glycerophosphotransferase n=1 Tax=Paucidesulfovibrio gracilis DSM 16080 TaxID=1121449 RepID=A0A1T4W5M2_9BACT|nr:CDP-glycerol glycerophosphotransferase family protein [Paucidesulfovibrio gracilis]SKA72562.1 CDP-glycerol glycerophosphotransferase [Paucidesulfovibrio gracilis DSM 16080]
MELDAKTLALLHRVARLTPAQPRRVAVMGRGQGSFGGNAKYAFLHLLTNAPDLDTFFVTLDPGTYRELRSAGLPCELFPQGDSVQRIASAGTFLADDFHFKDSPLAPLLHNARIVQLWHGVGFKKIGFLEAESGLDLTTERRDYLRRMYSGYDALVSTSPFYTEHLFSTCFESREIIETGYPRNDVFFRRPTRQDMICSSPELYGQVRRLAKERTVALFVPTFRDGGGDFITQAALDLPALDAQLGSINTTLVLKMHSFSNHYQGLRFQNILHCPNHLDIYPLMPLFHGLITDYSSIFTDHLLLDKPQIFFPYDWDDYTGANRELQFDYDWITPGPKARDQQALLEALQDLAAARDTHQEKRHEIARLAFSDHDGNAGQRLLDRMRGWMR